MASFTNVFLVIVTPQGVTPGINYFVTTSLFSKYCQIQKRKKKKKSPACAYNVGFTETNREVSDMFSLYAINVSFS